MYIFKTKIYNVYKFSFWHVMKFENIQNEQLLAIILIQEFIFVNYAFKTFPGSEIC